MNECKVTRSLLQQNPRRCSSARRVQSHGLDGVELKSYALSTSIHLQKKIKVLLALKSSRVRASVQLASAFCVCQHPLFQHRVGTSRRAATASHQETVLTCSQTDDSNNRSSVCSTVFRSRTGPRHSGLAGSCQKASSWGGWACRGGGPHRSVIDAST